MGLVFIDLKKAFDTVDHGISCRKLEHYGILDCELAWFQSYLLNRKQFCRVNGVDSFLVNIDIGIQRGSCIGPPLFLIYINDLPQTVQHSHVHMYADDTSIYHQSHNLAQLNEDINSDLKQLGTWLKVINFL